MKAILAIVAILMWSAPALADRFCDGFERGYITGYQRASGSSLAPIAPLCPLQPLKRLNDPQDDFEFGYVLGLERGFSEARR
jgi:hypothetical protein